MKKRFPVLQVLFAMSVILTSCISSGKNDKTIKHIVMPNDSAYYGEKWRPQFHFSPEAHWMNDPNGLVYFDGEYHLFYQYYPDSTVWGPMHWGHAVSKNLTNWKHLPIALYPDSLGYIFSGSAVADKNNTSGFGDSANVPLVAVFTYHNPVLEKKGSKLFQNQGIAYSLDKGRTWTKYPGNPVIKNPGIRDFRDPKMFWNEKAGKWNLIMAVYDRVQIYSSADLKNWKFESEFGKNIGAHGGVWECPDLFPLKVEGEEAVKWVMLVSINPGGPNGGSATQYFTGDFDGHRFTPDDTNIRWADWGPDDYAGVTWSGVPAEDGRRLFIGWMSNWSYATIVPTQVWRSASTIPRELSMKKENGKYFLLTMPVREFGDLRVSSDTASAKMMNVKGEMTLETREVRIMQSEQFFGFDLSKGTSDTVGVILKNKEGEKLVIAYSKAGKEFFIDRTHSGEVSFSKSFPIIAKAAYTAGQTLKLHLIVDASSAELFVDDGRLVMTSIMFPLKKYDSVSVFSTGGDCTLTKAMFYGLSKIWH